MTEPNRPNGTQVAQHIREETRGTADLRARGVPKYFVDEAETALLRGKSVLVHHRWCADMAGKTAVIAFVSTANWVGYVGRGLVVHDDHALPLMLRMQELAGVEHSVWRRTTGSERR